MMKESVRAGPAVTAPVPVPKVKLTGTLAAVRQSFNLNWTSQPGTLYQMQWSTDAKNWTTVPPLMMAASTTSAWSDDGALTAGPFSQQASRFYRLLTPDQPVTLPAGTTLSFLPAMAGTSYLWDFGDGTTSTLENPSHTYAADGSHTVSLTVTDGSGPHVVSGSVATEVPSRILLTQPVLAKLRQKAAENAAEWQDFQYRLDGRLNRVIGGWGGGDYQGSQLAWLAEGRAVCSNAARNTS